MNQYKNMLQIITLLVFALIQLPSQAAERIVYLHSDALGSPVAASDSSGALLWREAYRPYGDRIRNEDDGTNVQWFSGKPHDTETGLSYFGARYYEPIVGRFMSADPQRFDEANIQSFNRYAYANNNPYKFVDPDGESPLDIGFLIVDSVKLAAAINSGVGVGQAFGDFAASVVGVVSPVPGVGQAIKVGKIASTAAKSVKPTLSTLHTRGTKIPGGRKIGDTLAGSNKIKNANGDTLKRVDFAPSKPHNGLSPHTHPNFRNQLPDGSIRSGVSRDAGPITRRDIIDAARQGGQRTGGL